MEHLPNCRSDLFGEVFLEAFVAVCFCQKTQVLSKLSSGVMVCLFKIGSFFL